MRNNYSQKFKDEIQRSSNLMTLDEIVELANKKYSYNTDKKKIREFMRLRQLKWKNYYDNKIAKKINRFPVGSERINKDGWSMVKIAPNKWMYKHRYIYEQYYNVKLTKNDFIIFLDHNRNNFDIDNLKKVSKKEMQYISGYQLITDYKNVTEVGIDVAKLMKKAKQKEENKTLNEIKKENAIEYYKTHIDEKREYARQYYYKNKEKIIEKNRKYKEKNREELNKKRKEYYQENKDKEIQYQKEYANFKYHNDKKYHDRVLENSKKYRDNHKEHYKEYHKIYDAKIKEEQKNKLKWYEKN